MLKNIQKKLSSTMFNDGSLHECQKCGISFEELNGLELHRINNHPSLICHGCFDKFVADIDLKRHQKFCNNIIEMNKDFISAPENEKNVKNREPNVIQLPLKINPSKSVQIKNSKEESINEIRETKESIENNEKKFDEEFEKIKDFFEGFESSEIKKYEKVDQFFQTFDVKNTFEKLDSPWNNKIDAIEKSHIVQSQIREFQTVLWTKKCIDHNLQFKSNSISEDDTLKNRKLFESRIDYPLSNEDETYFNCGNQTKSLTESQSPPMLESLNPSLSPSNQNPSLYPSQSIHSDTTVSNSNDQLYFYPVEILPMHPDRRPMYPYQPMQFTQHLIPNPHLMPQPYQPIVHKTIIIPDNILGDSLVGFNPLEQPTFVIPDIQVQRQQTLFSPYSRQPQQYFYTNKPMKNIH